MCQSLTADVLMALLTPITPAQFISNFPEFSLNRDGITFSPKYPQTGIQFWLNYAYLLLDPCRWRTILDLGAQMYAAHNLVLEALASDAVASGGEPGLATGPVASTGVGPVSVSFDVGAALNPEDGAWNSTEYGKRFAMMMCDFGAGGLIINGGYYAPGTVVVPVPFL